MKWTAEHWDGFTERLFCFTLHGVDGIAELDAKWFRPDRHRSKCVSRTIVEIDDGPIRAILPDLRGMDALYDCHWDDVSTDMLSEAESLKFLEDVSQAPLFAPGHWLQLGIADAASDRLVGDIGMYLSEDGSSGEVGFTLEPSAQGRGIASRAVREALQLMFCDTNVARILGITDERNLPSVRLLERLGFEFIERRRVVFRGEPCTELVYALPRNDG